MPLKLYGYAKCSTCRNALKYLNKKGIQYVNIEITETPPSKRELEQMLKIYDGDLKKLFNTSGQIYRELKMSEKMPNLKKSDAIELLSKNGKLIKRPFALDGSRGVVGFKEEIWNSTF